MWKVMDPTMMALMSLMAGGGNWRQFAQMADAAGMPTPDTEEWNGLMNPDSGNLGLTMVRDLGGSGVPDTQSPPGGSGNYGLPPDLTLPSAGGAGRTRDIGPPPAEGTNFQPPPPGLFNSRTFNAGRPPPTTPGPIQEGNPEGVDLNNTYDLSGFTNPFDLTGTPPPGGGPGGLERALNLTGGNRNQNRFPNVRIPTADKPEFRGGVAGAQKAPDFGMKGAATPAQALMAALLGRSGEKGMRVPILAGMFGGRSA